MHGCDMGMWRLHMMIFWKLATLYITLHFQASRYASIYINRTRHIHSLYSAVVISRPLPIVTAAMLSNITKYTLRTPHQHLSYNSHSRSYTVPPFLPSLLFLSLTFHSSSLSPGNNSSTPSENASPHSIFFSLDSHTSSLLGPTLYFKAFFR